MEVTIMDYTNKQYTLDDGNTYVVIEQVEFNNHSYLYIANTSDEEDTRFVEIKNNQFIKIDPIIFENDVWPLFLEKFRN
jgi:hypothetical protein